MKGRKKKLLKRVSTRVSTLTSPSSISLHTEKERAARTAASLPNDALFTITTKRTTPPATAAPTHMNVVGVEKNESKEKPLRKPLSVAEIKRQRAARVERMGKRTEEILSDKSPMIQPIFNPVKQVSSVFMYIIVQDTLTHSPTHPPTLSLSHTHRKPV